MIFNFVFWNFSSKVYNNAWIMPSFSNGLFSLILNKFLAGKYPDECYATVVCAIQLDWIFL